MKRRPLYSKSGKPRVAGGSSWVARDGVSPIVEGVPEDTGPTVRQRVAAWYNPLYGKHQGKILVVASALVTLALVGLYDVLRPNPAALTQRELNAAVNFAIDERPRAPAVSTLSYANVIRSVVMVSGYDPNEVKPEDDPDAAPTQPEPGDTAEDFHEEFETIGTGVVIGDDGTILTNLHVAGAAPRLKVMFWDGTEADARIVGAQPENDLAVIMPSVVPDDLQPATLASTANLYPGDEVVAIGFPFGIGPSASAGVVSGLKRSFGDGEGRPVLTNLIQFDAAANPGNSGGPLVNADGEVVGIVTGILNPSGVRTFLGIGFAVPIENAAAAAGENPL